ncbi:Putative transporter protein SLAC1/Mae1/ Ssu1/TehA [Colletotrichum destructivum]|uniref:Transporter protein SLAC1/Mae1/ Ssu1/TehA n=1 Tax=Colletotrichum destructivum TaxID=34406 RepID=A0AAX4IX20_9PEZI|nr:Putative transporter protein SLAC1/Mae1/ Ssu1/TehA [Colletotrichum destructivum]
MAVPEPEPKPGGGEDLPTPPPPPPLTTTATTAASDRPVRPHRPVRDAVRSFSTQWFLVPQGTAVLATILHQLDYRFRGLTVISYLFWVAAAALLLSTLGIYAVRLALFPRHVLHTLRRDEVELAGLSSVSIAFTSVVQMASLTLVSAWGAPWGEVVYVLWWAAFALAALVALVLPFLFIKVYPSGVPHISPATQMPVIAALTAAGGGGTICASAALTSAQQVPVIVVSYLLIGAGLPLVFALDVLFWARLLGNDQPPRQKTFQDMILCGPWGQSSFALQMLGRAVVGGSFAGYASGVFLAADAAGPVGYTSIFAGLTAWGLATFWWFFAIMGVLHAFLDGSVPKKIPYTLAGWALVFPWGVYTNAAVQLGKLLDSEAFKVWSTCLAIMLVAIWLVNVVFTIRMLARR